MSRIAYVNGRYVTQAEAKVSIEDRGYQFADGVYEVIEVQGGALVDEALHLARLRRSLAEIRISDAPYESSLRVVMRETIARNRVRDGMVYVQMTRGAAWRDHFFPDPPVRPSLVVTARSIDPTALHAKAQRGIRVITTPDMRWKRPDIKSISLLPNVLAKQAAKDRGAAEAWLVDDGGLIREGAASNAWIVDENGRVITHPIDRTILQGVTRTTLLKLLEALSVGLVERAFSVEEAYGAREAFVTGATTLVMPVIAIDDRPVGDGSPGDLVRELRRRFRDMAELS